MTYVFTWIQKKKEEKVRSIIKNYLCLELWFSFISVIKSSARLVEFVPLDLIKCRQVLFGEMHLTENGNNLAVLNENTT